MEARFQKFAFKERRAPFDWNSLKDLDIDRIVETGDTSELESRLEELTFSNFSEEELESLPESKLKELFRLSQLSLELLQKKLQKPKTPSNKVESSDALTQELKKTQTFSKKLRKQMQSKQKILQTYEYLLKQPATSEYIKHSISRENAVKCPDCHKYFVNQMYLDKHIEKRHVISQHQAIVDICEQMKMYMLEMFKASHERQQSNVNEFKEIFSNELAQMKLAPKHVEKETSAYDDALTELTALRAEKEKQAAVLKYHQKHMNALLQENSILEVESKQLEAKIEYLKKQSPPKKKEEESSVFRKTSEEIFHMLNKVEDNEYGPVRASFSVEISEHVHISHADPCKEWGKKFLEPIEEPSIEDVAAAATAIGIDPVKETRYLHLAKELLRRPIPRPWKLLVESPEPVFVNTETKETSNEHPGIAYYSQECNALKQSQISSFSKIAILLKPPVYRILEDKYSSGLLVSLPHDSEQFMDKRVENEMMIDETLKSDKKVTNRNIQVMEKQINKKKETNPLLVNAYEKMSAELLTHLSRYKAVKNFANFLYRPSSPDDPGTPTQLDISLKPTFSRHSSGKKPSVPHTDVLFIEQGLKDIDNSNLLHEGNPEIPAKSTFSEGFFVGEIFTTRNEIHATNVAEVRKKRTSKTDST